MKLLTFQIRNIDAHADQLIVMLRGLSTYAQDQIILVKPKFNMTAMLVAITGKNARQK